VTQHAGLSQQRWAGFTLDQQILMIANEMHRASKLMAPVNRERLHNAYERVLYLTDLTILAHSRHGLRRELLRWRDLAARLYVENESDPPAHAEALRSLLRFTPEASRQIPHVIGS
jgi:hypothetical protein